MDGNLNLAINNMKEQQEGYSEELTKAFEEILKEMFTKEELEEMETKHQQLLKEMEEKPTHNED